MQPRSTTLKKNNTASDPSLVDAQVTIEDVHYFKFGPKASELTFDGSYLLNKGSAKICGDVICIKNNVLAIGDATNAVYSGDIPLNFDDQFGRKISGEEWLATYFKENVLLLAEHTPFETANQINQNVAKQFIARNLDINLSHKTPGIVGAICNWGSEQLNIAYWGDVVVIVETNSGEIKCSKNQVYKHEVENLQTISDLRAQCSLSELWVQFKPILEARRLQRTNNPDNAYGYGILNGQANFGKFIGLITVRTEDVRKIFLSTDGFIGFEDTNKLDKVARDFLSSLSDGTSLVSALNTIRMAQLAEEHKTHTKFPEALGLIIDCSLTRPL